MESIKEYEDQLRTGANPRDVKARLAFELVKLYTSEAVAYNAQEQFDRLFKQHERPQEIPELKPTSYDIVTILIEAGFASSKTDARHAIDGGGVRVNDEKIEQYGVIAKPSDVIQKGKRFFVRIVE